MNSSMNLHRNWLIPVLMIGFAAAFVTAFYKGLHASDQRPPETSSPRRARRSVYKQIAKEDLKKAREAYDE